MNALSSRERVLAALRRESVDHPPFAPFFNVLHPSQRRGHTWNFPWAENAPQEEQVRTVKEELGLDPVVHIGFRTFYEDPETSSRVWRDEGMLHKRIETPAGAVEASVRLTADWPHGDDIPFFSDFNVGHYGRPWIESHEDLECFRWIMRPPHTDEQHGQNQAAVDRGLAMGRKFACPTMAHIGMGLTGAQHLFGVTPLCMFTVTDPDLVDAYLELEHQTNVTALEWLAGQGVDMVRRNGFYETSDFYAPDVLERFLAKRLDAETAAAHAGGMLMTYTVNTGVMPMLNYLNARALDTLLHVDIAFQGFDLAAFRDALAVKKSFWIGPSSTYHIWPGPEATRKATRQVFEVLGTTGVLLTPCPSIHSIMPWESFEAMHAEWRRVC